MLIWANQVQYIYNELLAYNEFEYKNSTKNKLRIIKYELKKIYLNNLKKIS